jgi:predicted nuclease of predicted toxin-antitoxin system
MNFLADEGVDRPIVERLRQVGYHVLYVAEMAPSISDDEVLDLANRHNALLITADKDFGELVFRLGRINQGVVLLRLAGLMPARKAVLVVDALQVHAPELLNAFSVISPGMIRIRSRNQV